LIVVFDRFRQFRGRRTRSRHYDGDTADGTGEALRRSIRIEDEGDERMRELIEQLKAIEARPNNESKS
jgi:hypothetical protein